LFNKQESYLLEWFKCITFSIKVSIQIKSLSNDLCSFFLSREGHVNIVQELLSRGANVNAATKVFDISKRKCLAINQMTFLFSRKEIQLFILHH
jgi:hypothetical protein